MPAYAFAPVAVTGRGMESVRFGGGDKCGSEEFASVAGFFFFYPCPPPLATHHPTRRVAATRLTKPNEAMPTASRRRDAVGDADHSCYETPVLSTPALFAARLRVIPNSLRDS